MTFGNFISVPTRTEAFGDDLRAALDGFVADLRKLVVKRIELVTCTWNESPSVARARASAVKQYLLRHGVADADAIQVRANCTAEPARISLRLSLRREVEARVAAALPEPPPRNALLWPLPPVVLKRLPQRPQDFDAVSIRRLDHAARDYKNTGVSWLEVSIIAPRQGQTGVAPEDLDAYVAAVHLVKDYLVGRGLDAAMVHVRPWPGRHLAPGGTATQDQHVVLIEAWAPEPDPMPRLAFTEGYMPALRDVRRYA
ncbi:hypothetical protein [Achromobacter aloeverae]|uniref:hypothetical protein n=1 Tax=Achromobacter aloeverae TaxID=1750518 RepID=UPI00100E4B86|nr:hypothetical protein [Achromobacter aloeverae]